MIKFMFKIKTKAKKSQNLAKFLKMKKTFWMKKIDKIENFTKKLNYWHFMDLKM